MKRNRNIKDFFTKKNKTDKTNLDGKTSLIEIPANVHHVLNDDDSKSAESDSNNECVDDLQSILSDESDIEQIYPEYYSEDIWKKKLQENDWIYLKNQKLGCTICRKTAKFDGPNKTQGLKLSNEWIEGNNCVHVHYNLYYFFPCFFS